MQACRIRPALELCHPNGRGPNGNPNGRPNVLRTMRAVTTGRDSKTTRDDSGTSRDDSATTRDGPTGEPNALVSKRANDPRPTSPRGRRSRAARLHAREARPRSTPAAGHATMPIGRPWTPNGAGRPLRPGMSWRPGMLWRQCRGDASEAPRPASLVACRRHPIRRGVKAASRILVPMVQVRSLAAERPAPRKTSAPAFRTAERGPRQRPLGEWDRG